MLTGICPALPHAKVQKDPRPGPVACERPEGIRNCVGVDSESNTPMPTAIRSSIAIAGLGASFVLAAFAQDAPSAAASPEEAAAATPAASAKAERVPKNEADIATAPVKEARSVT